MNRQLRLSRSSDTAATFRDSYPFPSAAASALTPSAPPMSSSKTLPFPFSHPENMPVTPRVTIRPEAIGREPSEPLRGRAKAAPNMMGIIPTDELIRQIDQTLDRIKLKTEDLRDQIDNYHFPSEDEDRPRAA